MTMRRYVRLWIEFLKSNIKRETVFRFNFFLHIIGHLFWFIFSCIFFKVIYMNVHQIGDWNIYHVLTLIGVNQLITSLYEAFWGANLRQFQTYVEEGDFDHFILKPVDLQFLVSTRFIKLSPLFSLPVPLFVIFYSLSKLSISFSPLKILLFFIMLFIGLCIRYFIGFLIMSLSFYMTRVESLFYLQNEFFRYAGYPISIFTGISRLIFVFIIPVAIIANFPTMVLIEKAISFEFVIYAILLTLALAASTRCFFYYSIRKYTSASS